MSFKNRTLVNIEVPSYWHLEPQSIKTKEELEQEKRMNLRVIYVKLKKSQDVDEFGRAPETFNIYKIAELFTKFGDINVSPHPYIFILTLSFLFTDKEEHIKLLFH